MYHYFVFANRFYNLRQVIEYARRLNLLRVVYDVHDRDSGEYLYSHALYFD